MKKIIDWLGESNRWKHLVGGFALCSVMQTWWDAAVLAVSVASALEFKDRAHGEA